MKLTIILSFLIPMLDGAAAMLENVDANTTGVDDQVAKVLRSAAAALREYSKP